MGYRNGLMQFEAWTLGVTAAEKIGLTDRVYLELPHRKTQDQQASKSHGLSGDQTKAAQQVYQVLLAVGKTTLQTPAETVQRTFPRPHRVIFTLASLLRAITRRRVENSSPPPPQSFIAGQITGPLMVAVREGCPAKILRHSISPPSPTERAQGLGRRSAN